MKNLTLPLLLVAAGCASPRPVAAPVAFDDGPPPLVGLIETPRVAAPAAELPEARRREWLEAHQPKVEPVRVERVVVREVEPVRYVRTYDRCDDWSLPVWWSVGWWGGHRRHGRHGHGWNWGVGFGDRWCW